MFLNDGLGRGSWAEGLGQLAECMPSTHQALGSVYKYPINQAYLRKPVIPAFISSSS